MHPELIKARIRIAGGSLASISRELGVSKMAVTNVVSGRNRSIRIARRICEVTGLNPDLVWPGRYPEFVSRPIDYRTPIQEAA